MRPSRDVVFKRIRSYLPFESDHECNVREEYILADLGVESLHLITMILGLRRDYVLDPDRMTNLTLEMTVGDLVTMVIQGTTTEGF